MTIARRGVQLTVVLAAVLADTVFKIGPPGPTVNLAAIPPLLALCALVGIGRIRGAAVYFSLGFAAIASACGLLYWSTYSDVVLTYSISGERYIVGSEFTSETEAFLVKHPSYRSPDKLMGATGGRPERVWTSASLTSARIRLALLYLAFTTALSISAIAALESFGATSRLDRRKLRQALLDAFPSWASLHELVRMQLDVELTSIVSANSPPRVAAQKLVDWASKRRCIVELLIAARNQNPRNQNLAQLSEAAGVSPTNQLEKIVNDNRLQLDPAVWREGQVTAEWRVCRIDINGNGTGTGFLVGPDLILTNYHVIKSVIGTPAKGCRARFDHKVDRNGADVAEGTAVAFADAWLVDHSPYSQHDLQPEPHPPPSLDELDYALIRLAEPIGARPIGKNLDSTSRGWVTLSQTAITTAPCMVTILQYPNGRTMKLAIGMVESLKVNANGTRVQHGIPTEPGSSGSPLYDKSWNVLAIHHSGDPSSIRPSYNEAIPIQLIAQRAKVKAALGSH